MLIMTLRSTEFPELDTTLEITVIQGFKILDIIAAKQFPTLEEFLAKWVIEDNG